MQTPSGNEDDGKEECGRWRRREWEGVWSARSVREYLFCPRFSRLITYYWTHVVGKANATEPNISGLVAGLTAVAMEPFRKVALARQSLACNVVGLFGLAPPVHEYACWGL